MKNKHLLLKGMLLLFATSLIITSCRKEDRTETTADNDTTGAEDNMLAEKAFDDLGQISDEAAFNNKEGLNSYKVTEYDGIMSGCATVDTAYRQITIDFGTVNCLCKDGRYRRGKIFISYTPGFHGRGYWDSLARIGITTGDSVSGYFVNDNQVKGFRSVTNNGRNAAHHLNWHIDEGGEIIKANNGGTIIWNSTRNREWIAGYLTPFKHIDDVFSTTGTSSGGLGGPANGFGFTMTITSPLLTGIMGTPNTPSERCRWITAGTLEITPTNGKSTRYVDYSPGVNPTDHGLCDNITTVTINSKVRTVYMK